MLRLNSAGNSGAYELWFGSPQTFDLPFPATVSPNQQGPGAGTVEGAPSEDRYRFTTPADGTLQLEFSNTTPALHWDLVVAGTNFAIRSGGAADASVPGLPAGNYELVVGGWTTGNFTAAISLTG